MSEFHPLPVNSVISRDESTPLMSASMYKVENYIDIAHVKLQIGDEETNQTWVVDGAECEVLMVGSAWKKGKIRIKIAIEFCEDSENNTDELSVLRTYHQPTV